MPPPSSIRAVFPSGPLLDEAGDLSAAWRGFFMALYSRTGNAAGQNVEVLAAQLTQASNDLNGRDDALAAEITAETAARRVADSGETTARQAGDAALQASMLPLTGGTLSGPLAGPAAVFGVVATGTLNTTWTAGTAAPTASATEGSLYSRQGGGAGAHLYVCQGGTVWLPVAGV